MIIRPRPHGWQLLYILRGSIVKAIAPKVLAILILSIAVAAVVELAPPTGIERVSVTPFTLLGLVLSSSSASATAPATSAGGKAASCGASWSTNRVRWPAR